MVDRTGTSAAWPQDDQLLHNLGRDLANSRELAELEPGQRIPRDPRPVLGERDGSAPGRKKASADER